MLLPILTLVGLTTRKAEAQLQLRETWAVVEFTDKTNLGKNYGQLASELVNTEFAKLVRYDMVLADTINRFVTELGYQNPVSRPEELGRLGQSIRANTIVSGDVAAARIVKEGGGKKAEVKLRIMVRDVASGVVVNGAALRASSAVRTGEVDDDTLYSDALAQAAFQAVTTIGANTLPKGTVLNTTDRNILINQGSRTGFQQGQEVIITRGREQVASGKVGIVEPDSAFVKVSRQLKGVQPGDRVQVVFSVPEVSSSWGAGSEGVKRKSAGNMSSIISLLLVLGLAAILLGQGRGSNNNTVTGVSANLLPPTNDQRLTVGLNWRPDGFIKEPNRFAWHVYRNDVSLSVPIMVVDGRSTSAIDDGFSTSGIGAGRYDANDTIGCPGRDTGVAATPTLLNSGVPVQYSIRLIYRLSPLDTPGAGGGSGGGGTTGGGTTGGGTTGGGTTGGGTTGGGTTGGGTTGGGTTGGGTTGGGTTGGGTTGGGTTGGDGGFCYFQTGLTTMQGTVTPFRQATLFAPDDQVTLAAATVFRFESMRRPGSTIPIEYTLQFSPSPLFPANNTQDITKFIDTASVGTVSTPSAVNVLAPFAGSAELYWRVGVRNANENTTPVFSGARKFKRPVNPPNP
jgi:hypothetical protein